MSAEPLLPLLPDRPLRFDATRHAELRVTAGTVWITASDAAGDVFLAAGGRYRLPRGATVLAEAVRGPAAVRLLPARRHAPALLARLRHWLLGRANLPRQSGT